MRPEYWVASGVCTALAFPLGRIWGGWFLDWRSRKRAAKKLQYVVVKPSSRGIAGVGRQIGESMEAMAWGRSSERWRRECEASLRASRKRRGLYDGPVWIKNGKVLIGRDRKWAP